MSKQRGSRKCESELHTSPFVKLSVLGRQCSVQTVSLQCTGFRPGFITMLLVKTPT
uniref:Uncharacterized protein n=1 Tax=Anguilla anguilla TaxID=7936 RepID=A0A0E9QY17_ANGAN